MMVQLEGMVVDLRSQPGGKTGEVVIASLAVVGRFRPEILECVVGKLTNHTQAGDRWSGQVDVSLRPGSPDGKRPARMGGYIAEL